MNKWIGVCLIYGPGSINNELGYMYLVSGSSLILKLVLFKVNMGLGLICCWAYLTSRDGFLLSYLEISLVRHRFVLNLKFLECGINGPDVKL